MTDLVTKAIAGNAEAIEQLVHIHKPKLITSAFSYMKNYEEAQDIVQETFLKAFQSLHQLKEPQYFSTWLYKILIRQCFSTLNQQKRTRLIQTELQQLQLIQQDESTTYDHLYEALESLRQDYQTALLLHYFYDFKLQEIAAMTNKPLNTVKIQLHRARIQVKKQLETMSKSSIKQQDVNKMLKEQLKNAALKFFTVPAQYELCIDDLVDEKAVFYWKDPNNDEGYYVELDIHGKLLSLSQPPITTNVCIPSEDQQCLAEQFLTSEYAEALDYFTLSKITENEDRTRFQFEQFVGDYPLASFYCSIEIALNGQVLDFNFRGYTKNPPSLPDTLVKTETILAKLFEVDWTPHISYLSSELYTVPVSGLYVLYESPVVYRTFNAMTGVYAFEGKQDEEAEKEEFAPFPIVTPHVREETIETIIGVNPSMRIVRQFEGEQGEHSIVWREKDWHAPNDKSMNSFIQDRYEQSVKAKINVSTNQLKGFVWFKERTGNLELTFEACRNIAVTFIATYYHEYVPYLQMMLEKPSFNELHRAFFTFPVTINGHHVDGHMFLLSINKTTGNIDMLMTPEIEISTIKAYTPAPLLELAEAKHTLKDVDAFLEWAKNYDSDEPQEVLNYSFGHYETKQSIKGINAVTGKLILMKF